jgi:hypothetical protein
MRQPVTVLLLAIALAAAASPAYAQWRHRPVRQERGWFGISGGIQAATSRFDDAFDLTLYTEPERITVDYPSKGALLIAANGGYRVWRRLSIGLGVTRAAHGGDAAVKASLPHPFFDNTFRIVEGTTNARRTENGAHLQIGWSLRLSPRLRVILTGGPSVLNVNQTFVTDVRFSEAFPFDSAAFTSAVTKDSSRTAIGFNAGADLWWTLRRRRVAVGALVQVAYAQPRLDAGNGRRVPVDAGGAQVGVGLRKTF